MQKSTLQTGVNTRTLGEAEPGGSPVGLARDTLPYPISKGSGGT